MNKMNKQLIDARGKRTQTDVATAIGISVKHLSKLERNQRNPSLKTAWKLANFYGKSMEELFSDILEEGEEDELQ